MSKRTRMYRTSMRMWGNGGGLMSKRFNKAIDRMERSASMQEPHIIFVSGGWEHAGGRGLLHKGRKP
jgi:hypothetical protein